MRKQRDSRRSRLSCWAFLVGATVFLVLLGGFIRQNPSTGRALMGVRTQVRYVPEGQEPAAAAAAAAVVAVGGEQGQPADEKLQQPAAAHPQNSHNSTQCLLDTGFDWVDMNSSSGWALMSTVEAHPHPSGLQARCDMVIGSRHSKFERALQRRAWVRTWQPRTVFVRNDLLQTFVLRVLPCLAEPFVLLAGDSDLTLPRQVDLRFPKALEPSLWQQLLQDDRVVHMFVENLDESTHPKVSGLPLGVSPYNYPGRQADFVWQYVQQAGNKSVSATAVTPLSDRPLRAMHAARMRDGKGQWADRQRVQDLCVQQWAPEGLCESPQGAMDTTAMWQAMQAVPFVICVHGGGLDPSPKAWEALLLGSIPIMQHFAGDDAYRHLPVVFVDSWHEGSLTAKAMEAWRAQLRPWFEEPGKRAEVLRRLGSQFWWDKVLAALEGRLEGFMMDNPSLLIEWRQHPQAEPAF